MTSASKVMTVVMALMMAILLSGNATAKKGKILVSDERQVLAACERTWGCQAQSNEGITVVCSREICTTCSDRLGKCYTPADMKGGAAFGCNDSALVTRRWGCGVHGGRASAAHGGVGLSGLQDSERSGASESCGGTLSGPVNVADRSTVSLPRASSAR